MVAGQRRLRRQDNGDSADAFWYRHTDSGFLSLSKVLLQRTYRQPMRGCFPPGFVSPGKVAGRSKQVQNIIVSCKVAQDQTLRCCLYQTSVFRRSKLQTRRSEILMVTKVHLPAVSALSALLF